MKRGEVYWAQLVPRSGSEQTGTRPVVVLSNDIFNAAAGWRSVIVVPCSTSDKQRRRGPTSIPLEKGAGGLRAAGVALCHQVTTLDRSKLTRKLGTLSPEVMRQIEDGILAAMDIER